MLEENVVSAAELGEWLGLHERQVRKLAERNVIDRDGRGRYLLKRSIRAVAIHQREVSAGRASSGAADEDLDLVAERARLAKHQADAQEMTNAVRRGELIEIAKVCGELEGDLNRVRTRLLAIPAEQAAALARLRTPLSIQEALRDLMIDVLTELSDPANYGAGKRVA